MLITKLFNYVLLASSKYNIDETHNIQHSMQVLHHAKKIYDSEIKKNPLLKEQERIIFGAAVLHDMCDKKYVDENVGLREMEEYLEEEMTPIEIYVIKTIISTMSYSKVKKVGYPTMGLYQQAFHIVRESDLLAAYDFDRCMLYSINRQNTDVEDAFEHADHLFERRMFKHIEDGLFVHDYSICEAKRLNELALQRLQTWKDLLEYD